MQLDCEQQELQLETAASALEPVSDCCLRDWFYLLIRALLVDKGCITQSIQLGDTRLIIQ